VHQLLSLWDYAIIQCNDVFVSEIFRTVVADSLWSLDEKNEY
jgi:hypothetical protein